jgi:hypothetical protein
MSSREHGTRAKYVAESCRCDLCRKANREYAAERKRTAITLISMLPRKSRGSVTVVKAVGKKGGKRGESELRPIEMKNACPGIGGTPCNKQAYLKKNSIGGLCSYCREHVISKLAMRPIEKSQKALARLSKHYGLRTLSEMLDIGRTTLQKIRNGEVKLVTPETEQALLGFRSFRNEPPLKFCVDCGLSHAIEDRLSRLNRMLPCTYKEIWEVYPCTYPDEQYRGRYENRMLFRDLHALGAVRGELGIWFIPRPERDAAPSRPSEPGRTTPSFSRTWQLPRSTRPSVAPPRL